jgi:hypothetical protein
VDSITSRYLYFIKMRVYQDGTAQKTFVTNYPTIKLQMDLACATPSFQYKDKHWRKGFTTIKIA